MIIKEFNDKLKKIKNNFNKTQFQIQSILIASMQLNYEKCGSEEQLVRYDELRIVEEYLYKEKELIYFISQFLTNINSMVDKINHTDGNISFPPTNDKFQFYFDSMITQLYLLFESEQRVQIQHYFNKDKDFIFYPNRNQYGLWWEVYMLRNRIVHYTKNRYLPKREDCACYHSFSSKCNMIRIDQNNNITINSTLIDIYKDDVFKKKIEEAIISKENPFDLLFPNKSAKGRNKKYPVVSFIDRDIWFDYASSGIRLLNQVSDFLNSINKMFFNYFYNQLNDKEKLMNSSISLFIDEKEFIMSIKEIY